MSFVCPLHVYFFISNKEILWYVPLTTGNLCPATMFWHLPVLSSPPDPCLHHYCMINDCLRSTPPTVTQQCLHDDQPFSRTTKLFSHTTFYFMYSNRCASEWRTNRHLPVSFHLKSYIPFPWLHYFILRSPLHYKVIRKQTDSREFTETSPTTHPPASDESFLRKFQ